MTSLGTNKHALVSQFMKCHFSHKLCEHGVCYHDITVDYKSMMTSSISYDLF